MGLGIFLVVNYVFCMVFFFFFWCVCIGILMVNFSREIFLVRLV